MARDYVVELKQVKGIEHGVCRISLGTGSI